MNRRAFLRALGLGAAMTAGVAAGVLDPEQLLWRPGAKKIFLPSLKFVQHFNVNTAQLPTRLDVLYGFATIRPEYAGEMFGVDWGHAGGDATVVVPLNYIVNPSA